MNACDQLMREKFYGDFFIEVENNPYLERRLNEIIATYEAKGESEEAKKLKNNKRIYVLGVKNILYAVKNLRKFSIDKSTLFY